MGLHSTSSLREIDEGLSDLIESFLHEAPLVVRDAGIPSKCGPIAFAFAVYLRANSYPGGLIHVTGRPPGYPPGTGHYMATSQRWVLDWSYRQFAPAAPLPVIYERADLEPQQCPLGLLQGREWHPWTHISGELEWDDPLYPDFVEYDANTEPLAYVVPGTDDPEWVTPYDER